MVPKAAQTAEDSPGGEASWPLGRRYSVLTPSPLSSPLLSFSVSLSFSSYLFPLSISLLFRYYSPRGGLVSFRKLAVASGLPPNWVPPSRNFRRHQSAAAERTPSGVVNVMCRFDWAMGRPGSCEAFLRVSMRVVLEESSIQTGKRSKAGGPSRCEWASPSSVGTHMEQNWRGGGN